MHGPFTGKGYNLGIIDDPYKGPEDAKSALQRERLIDWLKSVWFTRAEPGRGSGGEWQPAAQVVVQTRWDHQDMIAWLLAQESEENPERWTVLNLPAIAEPIEIAMAIPQSCTRVPDWRQPGKASRAHAVAPLVEAGQVRFHRRSESLTEELLAFSPRGGIDDQVDAFCQGVLWIEAQYWRGRGHSSVPLPMLFSR